MLNSEELINKVKVYNKFLNPEKLNKAYNFAVKAHSNQKRESGDPYSVHPIEVANILTDLKLDSATITTGLLHDTIEDTFATYDTIKGEFGDEVADLVDGVTKISVLENAATSNSKAENFRKLILATSKDIRVLLVKIADRLHNMRTIDAISKIEKKERIAKETMEIYGREKTPFSIWRKVQKKRVSLEQITDIIGFRIILESIDDCYKTLGIIHKEYNCIPGKFKDYISSPKINGYESIHTSVIGSKKNLSRSKSEQKKCTNLLKEVSHLIGNINPQKNLIH